MILAAFAQAATHRAVALPRSRDSPTRWSDNPGHAGVPEGQRAILVDPTPAGAPRSMLDLDLSTRHGYPHARRDWNRPHHRLHHRAPSPPQYTVLIAAGDCLVTARRGAARPTPHTGTVYDQPRTIGRGRPLRCRVAGCDSRASFHRPHDPGVELGASSAVQPCG